MEMLVIKDGDAVYRVRKEETGCSVFGPQSYIEGDDVLWEVLKAFNDYGVRQGIAELKAKFSDAEPGQIESDLRDLAIYWLENMVFHTWAKEIYDCLGVRA